MAKYRAEQKRVEDSEVKRLKSHSKFKALCGKFIAEQRDLAARRRANQEARPLQNPNLLGLPHSNLVEVQLSQIQPNLGGDHQPNLRGAATPSQDPDRLVVSQPSSPGVQLSRIGAYIYRTRNDCNNQ